jgi:uncharacterized protein YbbC (DUF1343 family)
MTKVRTGLDILVADTALQQQFRGNVALLCHNASIDHTATPGLIRFHAIFSERLVCLFGPQHGYTSDDQDNMIETDHSIHPYLKIPVYSLYGETRVPTAEMLEGIDHLFVDLQDIGSRPYTYMYTLTLVLEKCSVFNIDVIVLDRPNPINGTSIEGNVLQPGFESFIGRHALPMRHGLTIGELALMHQRYWTKKTCNLKVIKMQHWDRRMYFDETGLPWVLPSPNIARPNTALTFPALVLFEGTNLSEGRGTVQPLEIFGHPDLEPFEWYENVLKNKLSRSGLHGFVLRPVYFKPTFDKHVDKTCGGLQIHITDRASFRPWRTGLILLQEVYRALAEHFTWRQPPFEYNDEQLPIDLLNGDAVLREWIENDLAMHELDALEDHDNYVDQRNEILLY